MFFSADAEKIMPLIHGFVDFWGKPMDNYRVIHRNAVDKCLFVHREKRNLPETIHICRKIRRFDRSFCRNRKNVPDEKEPKRMLSTKVLWKSIKTVDNSVDNVDNCEQRSVFL